MSRLIAHRGQKSNFPENTLESIQAAIACGATAVEFDVQMTADHVPVICHDMTLLKTAGVDINITENTYADLKNISVGEPKRFADKYQSVTLPSLQSMVAILKETPHVMVFIELKDESIAVFGIERFLKQVITQLELIQDQCVVIADDLQALLTLKKQTSIPIGWIIHRWADTDLGQAKQSEVDYLIINHKYCHGQDHDFAADNWTWIMYETCDPDKAVALFEQGIRFVETNDICYMLKQLPEYK